MFEKKGWKFFLIFFSEAEREKLDEKEFELEEERGKRKEVEAQLSDFARYVDEYAKLVKIVKLHFQSSPSQ